MKKVSLLFMLSCFLIAISFSSCSKDEDITKTDIVLKTGKVTATSNVTATSIVCGDEPPAVKTVTTY